MADAAEVSRATSNGCSHETRFPPKTVARVLRFQRALKGLMTTPRRAARFPRLSDGYFDQAHFIRTSSSLPAASARLSRLLSARRAHRFRAQRGRVRTRRLGNPRSRLKEPPEENEDDHGRALRRNRHRRGSLDSPHASAVVRVHDLRGRPGGPAVLICQVGGTRLQYLARAIDDLHAKLERHGDWMPLGAADEQKPAAPGTVEAWARSSDNPVGGWYGQKKGLRGRFGMYVPPVIEALGLAELEHNARNNPRPSPSPSGVTREQRDADLPPRSDRRDGRDHRRGARGSHGGVADSRHFAQRATRRSGRQGVRRRGDIGVVHSAHRAMRRYVGSTSLPASSSTPRTLTTQAADISIDRRAVCTARPSRRHSAGRVRPCGNGPGSLRDRSPFVVGQGRRARRLGASRTVTVGVCEVAHVIRTARVRGSLGWALASRSHSITLDVNNVRRYVLGVIRSFADDATSKVFERERVARFGHDLQRMAHRKLLLIEAADELSDLRVAARQQSGGAQEGERAGQHSIRINDQYRVCFVWTAQGPIDVEIVDYH